MSKLYHSYSCSLSHSPAQQRQPARAQHQEPQQMKMPKSRRRRCLPSHKARHSVQLKNHSYAHWFLLRWSRHKPACAPAAASVAARPWYRQRPAPRQTRSKMYCRLQKRVVYSSGCRQFRTRHTRKGEHRE